MPQIKAARITVRSSFFFSMGKGASIRHRWRTDQQSSTHLIRRMVTPTISFLSSQDFSSTTMAHENGWCTTHRMNTECTVTPPGFYSFHRRSWKGARDGMQFIPGPDLTGNISGLIDPRILPLQGPAPGKVRDLVDRSLLPTNP